MMRRLAPFVIALLLGLPACAPRVAEMGPAIATPAFTDNAFRTRDGLALGLQSWEAKAPQAVIVALHGMNDYANAFAMPGAWLAERGVTTYAYDQRGFGRSPNPGLWAGEDALAADARDAVAFARSRHPGVPVFLLGESMGGAVAIAAMTDAEPAQADGVILVAPAVWGWSSLPWSYQATLWIGAHTVPWAEVRPPRGLKISPSDNIEMLRALARDPLFRKDTRVDAVYGLADLMEAAYENAARISAPVLLLYGAHDEVIPKPPMEAVIAAMNPHPNVSVKVYPRGYHMLLRDLHAEEAWQDIARFVTPPFKGV